MLQRIRVFLFGQRHSPCATAAPVLHDPAAQRPHNLDDPFFDSTVQARFADIIVRAVQNKR
jgi:hypothetical protein